VDVIFDKRTGAMKKLAVAGLIVLGVTLMGALPSDAGGRGRHFHHGHGHGHVHTRFFVGFGPSYYWGGPYWGPYPYYYYPPAPAVVYTPPPVVIQRSEPTYIQQSPPPAPPAPEQQFWYYCQSAGGYYPNVANCPEEWVKVPPR
jgi:hypothetical protein